MLSLFSVCHLMVDVEIASMLEMGTYVYFSFQNISLLLNVKSLPFFGGKMELRSLMLIDINKQCLWISIILLFLLLWWW